MSVFFRTSLGLSLHAHTVMAAGGPFSLTQMAVQFGVPEHSTNPIRDLRSEVRALLDREEVTEMLRPTDFDLLQEFLDEDLIIEGSETEGPLRNLLKIKGEIEAPPEVVQEDAIQRVAQALPIPNGMLGPAERYTVFHHFPDGERYRFIAKPLHELLSNDRIVQRYPDGRLQVTFGGQGEVSGQDLFDAYRLFFYQAMQFRQILQDLQEGGADIEPLAGYVDELSETLGHVNSSLSQRLLSLAKTWIEIAYDWMERFQTAMREVAAELGLDIDPHTGRPRERVEAPPPLPGQNGDNEPLPQMEAPQRPELPPHQDPPPDIAASKESSRGS